MSKRCIRAREHVSLQLDGELSEFERALLAAHLAQCERCRRFEADVAALTERLRAAPPEVLSQPVALPSRSRRLMPTRVVQTVAAAAAVVAVGLGAAASLVDTTAPTQRAFVAAGATPDENAFIRQVRVDGMRPTPLRPAVGVRLLPIA